MLIIFNKKILFIFLLLFICNASSLFAMEIESTNDLPQSIIKNEDNETILKGFVYYLSQEFNYDKTYFDTINFDKSVENMLKFFSNDPKISAVLCFYSYLYFRKYIKEVRVTIASIHKPSDLLYLVLLMIYIAHQIICDKQRSLKNLTTILECDNQLFRRNLSEIMSTLNYRLSIEVLKQKMHHPLDINPNPCDKFITDRNNPYGNIPAYYNQLLEWGRIWDRIQ